MYLSRMYLNPQRRHCRALLGNPEMLHAAVLSSFPPGADVSSETGRVLWSIDRSGEKTVLWILSPTIPSFEHLQEQAGWTQQKTWETRDYSALMSRLMKGQQYAFRLVANPVHIVTEGGEKKRRVHQKPEHQLQWLLDRQDVMGIRFLGEEESVTASVVGGERLVFNRKGRKVTLVRVAYQGILEVTDCDLLEKTLTSGIGKAKAYGCGLMTLAKVGG
ncbi:type I-E CRISPR-associated protein Cas6/Cse3/CasE [Corynebacterium terpenotabidum]|uniref:Cse3 family CRISPR-associated protein n=1 Tax=Corynebacterium terpenotabidum Y-11 TaxID=1200352 RepID=S4XHH7_9CORY|nr:type I-E CRISPR-associated protein Cas6/Cse3/CasE [Corynebacterium terpenotabidum]AGP31976.1 Cse3 family CRISPR-associated protein [Corynebacterium terpenotabidum Y-11]